MHRPPPRLPFLLLFAVPLAIFLHLRLQRPQKLHSLPCSAPVWLIGRSISPATLSHFASHFPPSGPPPDLCIVFSSPFPPPAPFIHTLPLPLPALHLLAARAGAERILSAEDDAAFYTVAYGTGKGDVIASSATSFADLLPTNASLLHVRELTRAGFQNAESILRGVPAFPRGAPLQDLVQTAGSADTTFAKLRPVKLGKHPPPVIHFLPNVYWGTHPFFTGVSASTRHQVSSVLQPEDGADAVSHTATSSSGQGEDAGRRALTLANGAFASLPESPTLVERGTFWALAPLSCDGKDGDEDEDVVKGYVVQKTLHATGRSVMFVEPAMDVWRRGEGEVDLRTAVKRDERVEKVLGTLWAVNVPEEMQAEDAFLWLGRNLAVKGLISWCGVRAADEFIAGLRVAGLSDGSRTVRVAKKVAGAERSGLARTGVCVTGQMRSAPYTAANLLRRLRAGVGQFETMVVTERDDRVGSARLFAPVKVGWSRVPSGHAQWIEQLLNSTVVHETMSTRTHLHNYLRQLADMRDCLALVQERERERGRKFEFLVRVRPDTLLMNEVDSEWWEGKGVVVHSKRQSFYAMNDRFFAGDRRLMGRLLGCHDVFWWLVAKGRVYDRKAGDGTHMLWKKMVNSERFLARCASVKHVPLKAIGEIDARRVAYSAGIARWREFYKRPS